jgi:type III pantothenate kinase
MNAPTLIAVDIGNSSTKLGFFRGPLAPRAEASSRDATPLPQPDHIIDFPTGRKPPEELLEGLSVESVRWRVASVQREGRRVLTNWVETHRPRDDFRVLSYTDLPLTVRVDFPDRVGVDRLAAAVAANAIRQPGRAAIVVDAGSAVTVDLVAGDGAFEGGVILAGFRLQAEALFGGADLLPLAMLAPQDEPPPVLGKNTEAAIRSGLFWGAVGAVRELIDRLSADQPSPPHVFVTGGDLARLAPLVGGDAAFVPNMVLAGLAIADRTLVSPPGKGRTTLVT